MKILLLFLSLLYAISCAQKNAQVSYAPIQTPISAENGSVYLKKPFQVPEATFINSKFIINNYLIPRKTVNF
jgi:hypothetical protein